MAHVVEQIMTAVAAQVTALAVTGSNVTRDRVYTLEPADMPNLSVFQGNSSVSQNGVLSHATSNLTVYIEINVVSLTGATTTINQIWREIHIALMANRTLGLSSNVIDVTPLGSDDPVINSDGDQPIVSMRTSWDVLYRHSIGDPGV